MFFIMIRPPPPSTLFPYTTLFRSGERTERDDPSTLGIRETDAPGRTGGPGQGPCAQPDRRVRARATGERATDSLAGGDRKSTRLNSSHLGISYAVFCLKKKKKKEK